VPSKSPSRGGKTVPELNAPAAQVTELSRHLLRAQEQERKRISRELHDETGQGLMLLRLYLGMLASASEDPECYLKVQEAMRLLDRTIGDLRRIIARLSPRTLDELGLLAAIRKEARELSKNTEMKAQLELPESLGNVDHEIEIAIYRSVQEALHNIAKHSQARNFLVCLEIEGGLVRLLVEDDGEGFSRNGSSRGRSFGILGMRERIAALGGSVRIRSRKGRGTRVNVMLPAPQMVTRGKQISKAKEKSGHKIAQIQAKRGKAAPTFRGLVKPSVHDTHVHQVHTS
jgi:signal transduction histidine kinase